MDHSTQPIPVDTIATALRHAANHLAGHSDSPRLDAEILLGRVLGLTRSGLLVHGTDPLNDPCRGAFETLVARRREGVPVAYLTGTREFWSLPLKVTPDVLVPRPETELLVEHALALLPEREQRAVLDLGTGSGAIALAIATERPLARVVAVDVSAAALEVARVNAETLGLSRIDWRCGSWFEAVCGLRFDVIVANPPYIAADDTALARLAAEPRLALTPGPTGLEALYRIIDEAAAHLQLDGWLLLEHGASQSADVARRLEQDGFAAVTAHADHAGRTRLARGRCPTSHHFTSQLRNHT